MSEKLLNTAEAAAFLRASQASVRRWADAGLLLASRIGRRGARRFREEDLLRFMGRSPAATSPAAPVLPRTRQGEPGLQSVERVVELPFTQFESKSRGQECCNRAQVLNLIKGKVEVL